MMKHVVARFTWSHRQKALMTKMLNLALKARMERSIMTDDKNILARVQNYRKVVLIYEGLNKVIDKLLMDNDGGTENMSPEDLERYRKMARQRDELLGEIRHLEQQLLDNEDTL